MSKSRRYNKILHIIVNINEDCSEDTFEEDQYELGQREGDSESPHYTESGKIEGPSDSEEENFLKVCHNKKRMRIFSSSNFEAERTSIPGTSQNVMGEIEIAIDGIQWIKLKAGGSRGRTPFLMIFKDIAGLTGYAKRNIMSGCVTSAFELIIDRHIMEHIKDCTEVT
ncbi:uncharacterized protein LOC117239322 [Bombus vosnesenskii]|uniref:Uncharacterized protein LOC117239322 n=1 Tax=Bombus vosnesenskii TaxID=207650 RepID=A0A6J3L608_9HYME|nr:uncharacterized protein LOC117239322 [Bombus vosnesenskii]